MTSNPLSAALEPDFQTVFDALTSEQCRRVVERLDRPMTAAEIAEACDLPRSTAYRKVELLVEAGLLQKRERGRDAARYSLGFDEVVVSYETGALGLDVVQSTDSATAQLSKMWGELRTEAGGTS